MKMELFQKFLMQAIGEQNIRRLLLKSGTDKSKIDFVQDVSNIYRLFICLCETFLDSSILDAEI